MQGDSASAADPHIARTLDRIEQAVCVILFLFLVWRILPTVEGLIGVVPLLLLVSEGIVVILLLLRRSTDSISLEPRDWALAAAGTFGGMLVAPGGAPVTPAVSVMLVTLGLLTHIGAKLSLARSFGLVAANRGVRVEGLYRLVRHPMYAGYMIGHLGYLLFAPTLWNLAVYLSCWTLLVARIHAEERILMRDPDYRRFADETRWRLLPGLF